MLLRDLTKVYISEYEKIEDHGEPDKVWKYKGQAWLNMQNDVNELDRKSTGEIDYSTYKARTTKEYDIKRVMEYHLMTSQKWRNLNHNIK